MTHLETLRAIMRRKEEEPSRLTLLGNIDADLRKEAGMDGNLARLLQAARDLDNAALFPDKWTPLRSESADGQDPEPCWFVVKGDTDHDTYFRSEAEAQACADWLNAGEARS